MKKIYLIILTVFLNIGFYSCTPTNLVEAEKAPIAKEECCDQEGDIPPPPPPPPPGEGD